MIEDAMLGDPLHIDVVAVTFKTGQNISKFREGTPVLVSGYGIKFKGDLVSEDGNKIRIEMNRFDGFPTIPSHLKESKGWTIDKAKTDIRHIVKGPIQNLSYQRDRYDLIAGILSGVKRPSFDPALRARAEQIAPAALNPSQRKAFVEAFSANNYYLIQGPPGTGKTWVLAHLAAAFANEGKNVMVTAFTHTGINNAIKKVKEVTGYIKTGKIGKKYQADYLNDDDVTVTNGESLAIHGMNFQSRGVILGATVYAPNTRKLKGFPFDIVIFDEASQITVPLAVAAMSAGTKFIFIGDHKQLAPIVSENQQDKEFSKSIFEYLFQYTSGTMLQTTYRMNKDINRFPSMVFYDGKLVSDPSAADRRLSFKNAPNQFQQILDPEVPDIFVVLAHTGVTTYCQAEASLIANMVMEALRSGIQPKEIAIVTPYRAQVRLIQNALAALLAETNIDIKKIFIDTVERIQGQERDLVFYSIVTSDPKLILEKANFLLQPQRLNVALTRARKKRIVVGSSVLFDLQAADPEVAGWLKIFRAYYDSATRVSVEVDSNEDIF
jgi:DNA replication ATP-dependent helicase Dna2